MEDLEKEIVKLERYLLRQGRDELIRELRSLDVKKLENRLLGQAKHEQEIMDTKANDQKLKEAKEQARDYNSVYTEQLRMNKKIARFISLLMKEQGQ